MPIQSVIKNTQNIMRQEKGISQYNLSNLADLSIDDQKRFLLECLDKNHLYVNYSEIDDEEYGVGKEDKKLNSAFYNQ